MCKANCCKTYTITVTSFDVQRICKLGMQPDFAEFAPPKLLSFDPDVVLDFQDDYRGGILTFKSHPCHFLKDNRCTIHKYAPLSCRRYPYTLMNRMNGRFCPLPAELLFRIKGADLKKQPLLKELNAYKQIVKLWNKNPGKKEECLGFLLEKTNLFLGSWGDD